MHVAENSLTRTTITPWMDSAISDKEIKQEDDTNSEPDVAVGECPDKYRYFFYNCYLYCNAFPKRIRVNEAEGLAFVLCHSLCVIRIR